MGRGDGEDFRVNDDEKREHKFEGERQTKGQETQFEIWEHAVWNAAICG